MHRIMWAALTAFVALLLSVQAAGAVIIAKWQVPSTTPSHVAQSTGCGASPRGPSPTAGGERAVTRTAGRRGRRPRSA